MLDSGSYSNGFWMDSKGPGGNRETAAQSGSFQHTVRAGEISQPDRHVGLASNLELLRVAVLYSSLADQLMHETANASHYYKLY